MGRILLDIEKFIKNEDESLWVIQFARAFNDLVLVNNLQLGFKKDDTENQKYKFYLMKLNIGHLNEALKLIHNYKEYIRTVNKQYKNERLDILIEELRKELDFGRTVQSLNNMVLKKSRGEVFHYLVSKKDFQTLDQRLHEIKDGWGDEMEKEFSIEYGEKLGDLYFSFSELMLHNNFFTYASENLNYNVDEFYYRVGELTVKMMNILETLVKDFLKENVQV